MREYYSLCYFWGWHLCKEWVVIKGDDNQDGYGLVWLIRLHLRGMRCNKSWRQLWWLWWPPLLSSTSITHLPVATPLFFIPTRYLAQGTTVIWEIWRSSQNVNLRPKRISGAVDIPLPRLHLLWMWEQKEEYPISPPHDVFFPGWRMHIKASIRTRCYADLNLRRSSCAVYHRNLLPYWVSRGGGTNVGCMEVADSTESLRRRPDFFSK